MARASSTNPPRTRKRVEAETDTNSTSNSLKRAKDGSAFTRCEECNRDVAVVLIDMHSCSQESKLRMKMELQVIERAEEAKKATERNVSKKRVGKPAASKGKRTKKSTDPNMPKRPPTAYFLFMDDFRKSYKEAHPENNKVTVVSKEAGEKWKSMEEEEKKVYLDRAAELKEEYEKIIEKLNAENEDGKEEVVELDNDEECAPQEEEMEKEKGEECIQQEGEAGLEKGEESDQQEEVEELEKAEE